MKEALKHPEYRKVFKSLRDELVNCIIDAHDEERMSDYYGGIVARGIEMAASSLQGSFTRWKAIRTTRRSRCLL